ncbi:MAG: hypothetical protein OXG35_32495, partial [Acidobacteria bacterium]|nr:hypothetical protein [Acidobacteriota bacterium]
MRTNLAVPVLVLLVTVGETAAAQTGRLDYPQWRGRDRDGAASGFTEPSAWPAELTRRWTVPVGQGYATPIIVGHRVFMFTRQNGDEVMTSLNAR